jgi:hypothetical protein
MLTWQSTLASRSSLIAGPMAPRCSNAGARRPQRGCLSVRRFASPSLAREIKCRLKTVTGSAQSPPLPQKASRPRVADFGTSLPLSCHSLSCLPHANKPETIWSTALAVYVSPLGEHAHTADSQEHLEFINDLFESHPNGLTTGGTNDGGGSSCRGSRTARCAPLCARRQLAACRR